MKRLRIGTRGSKLALAQTDWVRNALQACHPDLAAEIVVIRTSGDRVVDRSLAEIGGKGLFVKELEEALRAGAIDCAVHSMKDLPGEMPADLTVAAVPAREDPRDVLVSRQGSGLAELATGAVVGTSSPRRAALLHAARPDLNVVTLRGNVDTRLRRLEEGAVDATVLAAAGLNRLGLRPSGAVPLDAELFLPAIGQGALAVQVRTEATTALVAPLEDPPTRARTDAERAFLACVGGSCVTPLAAHATLRHDTLTLDALIAAPDGTRLVRGSESAPLSDAEGLGRHLAERLLAAGGADILVALGVR